jgi:hypothetical protein
VTFRINVSPTVSESMELSLVPCVVFGGPAFASYVPAPSAGTALAFEHGAGGREQHKKHEHHAKGKDHHHGGHHEQGGTVSDDEFYAQWAALSADGADPTRGGATRVVRRAADLPDDPEDWPAMQKKIKRKALELHLDQMLHHHFRYLPQAVYSTMKLDEYSKIMNSPPMCAMFMRTMVMALMPLRIRDMVVADCTAGVGGCALAFAHLAKKVVGVEWDRARADMLAENATKALTALRRAPRTMVCVCDDSTRHVPELQGCHVMIFSPSFEPDAFYKEERVEDQMIGLGASRVTLTELARRKFVECPSLVMAVLHVPSAPDPRKVAAAMGPGYIVRVHIHSALGDQFRTLGVRPVLSTLEKRAYWQSEACWEKAATNEPLTFEQVPANRYFQPDIMLTIYHKGRAAALGPRARGPAADPAAARRLFELEAEFLAHDARGRPSPERPAERLSTAVNATTRRGGADGFLVQSTRRRMEGTEWIYLREAAVQMQYASAMLHFDMQYPWNYIDTDTGAEYPPCEDEKGAYQRAVQEDLFAIWLTLPRTAPDLAFLRDRLAKEGLRDLPRGSFVRTLLRRLAGDGRSYEDLACEFDPFRYEIDRAFHRLGHDRVLRGAARETTALCRDLFRERRYMRPGSRVPKEDTFPETPPYTRSKRRFYGPWQERGAI